MPFRESQEFKTKSRSVDSLLKNLLAYVLERAEGGYSEIIPTLAAERLGLSSVEVLGLLMLLENDGVLRHHYRIYCRAGDGVLADVRTKEEVPRKIYCKFCDKDQNEDTLSVELIFQIMRDGLESSVRNKAVA
jgi:hypothetical protein